MGAGAEKVLVGLRAIPFALIVRPPRPDRTPLPGKSSSIPAYVIKEVAVPARGRIQAGRAAEVAPRRPPRGERPRHGLSPRRGVSGRAAIQGDVAIGLAGRSVQADPLGFRRQKCDLGFRQEHPAT